MVYALYYSGCAGRKQDGPAPFLPRRGVVYWEQKIESGGALMLKQLKYFQSVVRLNSFSLAAEENYISQSAISQQVQALERELGFPLLERKNRSFTLTPAGAYFYQKSLILTADYERMCHEAARIAKGGQSALKIGYLRGYAGGEFQQALALFSEKHPDVAVSIQYGNHEELYAAMRAEEVDMILNDQRRAFSDEYVNLLLTTCESFVELSARSPLAQLEQITPQELKNVPCILVASEGQREAEQDYYQTVVGVQSEILYAPTLEEARLMVIGRKGFLPVEGTAALPGPGVSTVRVPLVRGGKPILRSYCAFWKKEHANPYVEEFAALLKEQFCPGNASH